MNTITKIALSLSLIALVAQPASAADYKNHAKKAAKVAFHAGQLFFGLNAVIHLKYMPGNLRYYLGDYRVGLRTRIHNASFYAVYPVIAVPTFLYYGYTGLKKEIFPNFKPTEWLKNKLEQIA